MNKLFDSCLPVNKAYNIRELSKPKKNLYLHQTECASKKPGNMINKDTFFSVFADFDADIIKQIISIYTNEHPIKFKEIDTSFKNRDFKNLRSVAHGLKGVLSQFFASEAQQQAKELEFFAKELAEYYGDEPDIELEQEHKIRLEQLIETLRKSSLIVIEELEEIKAGYE